MATRPLIRESLLLLDLWGLKPGNQCNVWSRVKVIIQIVSYIHLASELVLQLAFKWEDLDSVEGITEIGMVYQVFSRVVVILVYSQDLVRLLSKMEKFWSLNKYGDQCKQEVTNIITSARRFMRIFLMLFSLSGLLHLVKPFFTVTRTLPFLTYHPTDRDKSPQYELTFVLHVALMTCGCYSVVGFDGLFISLIIYIVCELKIIKQGFFSMSTKTRNEKDCLDEIKSLVHHHNLVLKCIKNLAKVYSKMLLSQFFCSFFCMCAGLLSLTGYGFPSDLQHFLKCATFLVAVLSQLLIYCSAGSYLIAESENVSEAVYESDWWLKTQPEVRRSYVLVIQRANKMEKLTAGGMFTLNLESFTNVVRTSLSFFTFVQALYSNTQSS